MDLSERVSLRYTARKVAARFLKQAMSLSEAAKILGVPVSADDATINKAYRKKFIENRGIHPDGDSTGSEAAKQLNIAKDTLTGQLKADRGGPTKPTRNRQESPGGGPKQQSEQQRNWREQQSEQQRKWEEQKERQSKTAPPVPSGSNASAALNKGGFEWLALTPDANAGSRTYVRGQEDYDGEDGYWSESQSYILLGKSSDQYAIMLLTRNRNTWGEYSKNPSVRWESIVTTIAKKANFMTSAPKVIKDMRSGGARRAKYVLLNGPLTENFFNKYPQGSLSFKDAVIGAGLVDESKVRGKGGKPRPIQIELEPVYNRGKRQAWINERGTVMNAEAHLVYDWNIIINGKPTQLTDKEVKDLQMVFWSVFTYDYTLGKKNITRMRGGGRFKLSGAATLAEMVKHLKPGNVRDAVKAQAEAMATKK